MGALDWALAVKEIAQAAAFLKAEGSPKVGATGFCMGGALTLLGAATCPDITCAAPFYGIPRDERVDLSKLDKPVLVRPCKCGHHKHHTRSLISCAMHCLVGNRRISASWTTTRGSAIPSLQRLWPQSCPTEMSTSCLARATAS